jgi:hypothetical protein
MTCDCEHSTLLLNNAPHVIMRGMCSLLKLIVNNEAFELIVGTMSPMTLIVAFCEQNPPHCCIPFAFKERWPMLPALAAPCR